MSSYIKQITNEGIELQGIELYNFKSNNLLLTWEEIEKFNKNSDIKIIISNTASENEKTPEKELLNRINKFKQNQIKHELVISRKLFSELSVQRRIKIMIYLSFLGFECSNEKDTLMNICLKSYDEYFEHFIENQEDLSDFIPLEFVKNDYILSTEKDYFFSRIDSSIINDYSEIIKYVCEIIDEKYMTNNILVTINSSNTLDELTSLKYAIHNMFKEHYIKNGENFKDHFNLYSSLSSLPLNFLFKLAEKLETRLLDSEQKKDVEKYLFKIKSMEK